MPVSISLSTIQSNLDIIQRITNCNSISTISVFTWLTYPHVFEVTFLGTLSFLQSFHLLMILQKSFPFRVICSFFNMKSMWNDLKRIFVLEFIKSFYVVKQGFFISNVIIELKMVMDPKLIRILNSNNRFLFIKFHSSFVSILHDNLFWFLIFFIMMWPNL